MALNCADWLITFLFAFIIYDAVTSDTKLDCGDQPLDTWFIGFYIICFSIRVMAHLSDFVSHFPQIISCLLIMLIPNLIVFTFIWNILGTVWLIQNLAYGNHCLSTFSLIIFIFIQAMLYITYFIGIAVIVMSIRKGMAEKRNKDAMKNMLDKYYGDDEELRRLNMNEFINTNKEVLKSMPLLDTEKEIIREHFSETVDEQNKGDQCGICLCDFEPGMLKTKIQCDHYFHFDCLVGWYRVKPQCPFCRETFRESLLTKYYQIVNREDNA